MKEKTTYYVYRCEDGSFGRLAMFGYVDGVYGAYGYEPGEGWVYMPGLYKIQWDITDYDEISEEEAMKILEMKEREK